jgi:hypothetical protein
VGTAFFGISVALSKSGKTALIGGFAHAAAWVFNNSNRG